MKLLIKNLFFTLVAIFLFVGPAANGLAHAVGVSPWISFATLIGVAVVLYLVFPRKRGGAYMAGVDVEIWASYIIDRLWRDNAFMMKAWSDDEYVLKGALVHIPQPGGAPSIAINRSSFPATVTQRTDTVITYALNEYTTAPQQVEYSEQVIVSYDKISSIMGDQMGYLTQEVADNLLLTWLDESVTTPAKIYTSGALAAATTDDFGTALTGTRRVMLANDIKAAALKMNLQKVPKKDRYALIEANMYDQLLTDLAQTQYRDFSATADPQNGIVGKLYGFTLLDRSAVATYSSSYALNAYGATSEATDSLSSIFWQKDCVARALGTVKVFENPDKAEYYGTIISTLLRMGGRRRRGDDCGVVSLIQANS